MKNKAARAYCLALAATLALAAARGSPVHAGPAQSGAGPSAPALRAPLPAAFGPLSAQQSLWLPGLEVLASWSRSAQGMEILGPQSPWTTLPAKWGAAPHELFTAYGPLFQTLEDLPSAEEWLRWLLRLQDLPPIERGQLLPLLETARQEAGERAKNALAQMIQDALAEEPGQASSAGQAEDRLAAIERLESFVSLARSQKIYAGTDFQPDIFAPLAAKKTAWQERLALLRAEELAAAQAPAASFLRQYEGLLYASPAMARVVEQAQKVARTKATVLIEGPTGSGKEVLANAIAQASRRKDRFIAVNVGAIPEELIESELFGHVKGAFTGAVAERRGLLAEADGGTLFLDEIEAASPKLQVKLLRFLERGELQRVGAAGTPVRVDARVIAATNQDLKGLIAAGKFREDLYYRLNVFPLSLPSLKERPEDILPLADHFLIKAEQEFGLSGLILSAAAREFLEAYPWPGNVRELIHALQRAAIMAQSGPIAPEHLGLPAAAVEEVDTSRMTLAEVEKRHIIAVWERQARNAIKTAAILGISRETVYHRLKAYGLKGPGAN